MFVCVCLLCVCVRARACVRACVCVCVCERERERESVCVCVSVCKCVCLEVVGGDGGFYLFYLHVSHPCQHVVTLCAIQWNLFSNLFDKQTALFYNCLPRQESVLLCSAQYTTLCAQ